MTRVVENPDQRYAYYEGAVKVALVFRCERCWFVWFEEGKGTDPECGFKRFYLAEKYFLNHVAPTPSD